MKKILFILLFFSISFGIVNAQSTKFYVWGNYNDTTIRQAEFIDTTQWHYVAFLYYTDRKVEIYVDGIKKFSGVRQNNSYSFSRLYLATSLYLNFSSFYKGSLDELRISKVVRTQTEIQDYYAKSKSANYSAIAKTVSQVLDNSTIGLWHFDESTSSTTITNSVAGSGKGTLSGNYNFQTGVSGNAINFDGISGMADCNFNPPETNMTIEFWFKTSKPNGSMIQPYGLYSSNIVVSSVTNPCSNVDASNQPIFNPLQDSIGVFSSSKILDAGTGYKTYTWNDGTSGQTLTAKATGKYKVTVTTNEGCTFADSVYLRLVNPKIIQRDTVICKGNKVLLSVDTSSINYINVQNTSNFEYKGSYKGKYYYYSKDSAYWQDAKTKCEQARGNLVCIEDKNENDYLKSILPNKSFWIGLWQNHSNPNYSEPSGGWEWINNAPFSYSDWNIGEPNNVGSEDFARCDIPGGWIDIRFNYPFNYLLETSTPLNKISYKWSNGDTTSSINVTPQNTTKYYVEISDGTTVVKDSVTITVNQTTFNPLSDSLVVFGTNKLLDAGVGFKTYTWNDGSNAQTLTATANGKYKVTVSNNEGCTFADSVYLSLVNPKIIQRDTAICKGGKVLLSVDTSSIKYTGVQNTNDFDYKGSFNGKYYYLSKNMAQWPTAKIKCEQAGGNLVCIQDKKENDYITALITSTTEFWIGLWQNHNNPNYSEPSGGWEWVNNTPISYLNWNNSEPNNEFGIEEYGIFWTGRGTWNDGGLSYAYYLLETYNPLNKISYKWSTGATTSSINVTPQNTTTYYVETTDGVTVIKDSVTIYVNPSVSAASSNPTICLNSSITNITHTTMGATGIGVPTGLPTGVSASWANNVITISGTPTVAGIFNYSIPTIGACGTVNATGIITVNPYNTVVSGSSSPSTVCINYPLTSFTYNTTGATGIGTVTGLPSGVSASWSNNVITISGTPTTSGTFNWSIPLTGGCGNVTLLGRLTVLPTNTVTVASSTTTPTNTVTTDGLVAYYPFNGNANDESGNGNNGTVYGATLTTDRLGNSNSAYSFNGDLSNYIKVPNSQSINISNSISLCGWFATNSNNCPQAILGMGMDSTQTGFNLLAVSFCPDRLPSFGRQKNNYGQAVQGLESLINKDWNFLCGVYDGKNLKLYINGTLVNIVSSSFQLQSLNQPLFIGKELSNLPRFFTGKLDEIRIYNRALSQEEITNLTNNSSTPTVCINSSLANITHNTTGATGIGIASGLPAGVSASWSNNVITISGTPTVAGTFNYSIPLTGGCGNVNATGTITVRPNNTVSVASSTPTVCINIPLTNITHTTTGATGIGTASGLPAGVSASWYNNVLTISGTPTESGTFNYSIPLTGGCGNVNATGTITVRPNNTVSVASSTPTLCINTPLANITHTTTGAIGIGIASGLPAGVSASWSNNVITISGTPTASGTFNYSIPLTGGCGNVNAIGTITVRPNNTVTVATSTNTVTIDGLVAYYPFNGNANDESGNGNNGTVYGATLTTDKLGNKDQAFNFDGSSNYIQITNPKFLPKGNSSRTISSWFYLNPTIGYNDWYSILSYGNGFGYGFLNDVLISSTFTDFACHEFFAKSTQLSDLSNRWHNLVVTYDSLNLLSVKMYLDGNFLQTNTINNYGITSLNTQLTNLLIGKSNILYASNYFFNGKLDEIRIYNRALSQEEITNLTNNSSTPTLCINSPLTNITHTTTGATGIGTASGLPAGVNASWTNNVLTISGTPTASGTFNYSIPLTGGCGNVNATGTIIVIAKPAIPTITGNAEFCTGNSLVLTTNGAQTLQWYRNNLVLNGQTGNTLTVNQSGDYTVVSKNTFGCQTTSSVKSIVENPLPNGTLTAPLTEICDGSSTQLLATGGATYQWSLNNNVLTGETNASYTASQAGVYTVDIFSNKGCNVRKSIQIYVNPKPVANFSLNLSNQCLLNNLFVSSNTSTVSSGSLTYNWTFGNGKTSSQISPSVVYDTSGVYQIKLLATSDKSCKDSIIKEVTVYPQPSIPTITGNAEFCTGNSLVLTTSGAQTLQWYRNNVVLNGQTGNTLTVNQSGDYTVISKNTFGCQTTSSVKSIVENPLPNGTLTAPLTTICDGSSTQLLAAGGATYQWSLNNNVLTGETNASYTASQAGVYTVDIFSSKGCNVRKSIQIYVNPKPVANFSLNLYNQCLLNNLFFVDTNKSKISSGSLTYNWIFGNGKTSSQISPSVVYDTFGVYQIKLVATSDKSCKDSIIKEVTVYPQPAIPTITGKSIVCEGTPTILTTSGGTTYQWLLNNNPISGAVNATIGATQAGVYAVDAISDKGCKSRSANPIALELVQKPQSNFTYNSSCTKVPMVLTSTSSTGNSGVVQYTWNLGYGISGTGQSISYTFSNPLTVNAKLVVTPMGCPQLSDSIVKSIVVENAPISIKYPDVNAVENKPLQLQARTFGVLYSWSPSTYLSSASVSNPKYTGIREQLYKISIKNSAGCNTVDTQMVKVFKDRDIYVPTGFTPDNDGHNDRLYPILVGIKQMNVFKVFNRWGVMVYDNKAANISTGWDGYYKNKQQPMDTYAWIAEGIDDDGNVLKKSGNVVLIR